MPSSSDKTIEIRIESLANSGDGVGRYDNKVFFVPFTLPDERVLIEVVENKKSFGRGRLLRVLEPSEHRIAPRCEVFAKCGGCDWQHLPYEQQLQWKQQNLQDVLVRIAKMNDLSAIHPIQPSLQQWNYRNRIQVHQGKKGIHYYAKGSQTPVTIQSCPIASEPINQWIRDNNSKGSSPTQKIELAEMADSQVQVFQVSQKGQSDLGFRQVNSAQNQFLNDQIRTHVIDNKIKNVVDLYCGQGNWSLNLSASVADTQCLGIDNNPINIKKAQAEAPANCQFILGDALQLLTEKTSWADLIIIDPPRAGCSNEVVEKLQHNPPPWLIYISCHPATMARDLAKLMTHGWKAKAILPVDMFPQTAHLECLTILQSATP